MPVGTPFTSENQPENRGRPKGLRNSKTILRELLAITETAINPVTGEAYEADQLEQIWAEQVMRAKRGEGWSIDRIVDRLEGKLSQGVNLGGQPDNPVQLVVDPASLAEAMRLFKGSL